MSDMIPRFGRDQVRVSELSDEALRDEVRQRRRERGQAGPKLAPSLPPGFTPKATRQSVAQWYANLELEPGAPLERVREAYERLSQQFSPERHADSPDKHKAAQELIGSLNHAYESLRAYLNR